MVFEKTGHLGIQLHVFDAALGSVQVAMALWSARPLFALLRQPCGRQ